MMKPSIVALLTAVIWIVCCGGIAAGQSAGKTVTVTNQDVFLSPADDTDMRSGMSRTTADGSLELLPDDTSDAGIWLSQPVAMPLATVEPVLYVGSRWHISRQVTTASPIRVSLRGMTNDEQTWQTWQPLDHMHYLADGSQYAHLVELTPATRFVQVRVQWEPGALQVPVRLSSIQLSFINPGSTPPRADDAPNDKDSISTSAAASVPVVSRTGWGCPDGQTSPSWEPTYTPVTHFIVHHTDGANTSSDWAAVVRAIWNYHTNTLGWGDIGYNYLIDPNGVVYEGRAGGDGAKGAHFSCMNSGTMGVALLGNYSVAAPSAAMIDSLEQLLAWKADTFDLKPLETRYHAASDLTLPTISGHRDGNTATLGCPSGTVCPGDVVYGQLPSLRDAVHALLVDDTVARSDVNNDGMITPVDAMIVINRIGTADASADVNADGQVTTDDARTVLANIGKNTGTE